MPTGNSNSQLKIGDVVRLKSGGPKMVIQNIFQDNYGHQAARCKYFKDDEPVESKFVLTSLEAVNE